MVCKTCQVLCDQKILLVHYRYYQDGTTVHDESGQVMKGGGEGKEDSKTRQKLTITNSNNSGRAHTLRVTGLFVRDLN